MPTESVSQAEHLSGVHLSSQVLEYARAAAPGRVNNGAQVGRKVGGADQHECACKWLKRSDIFTGISPVCSQQNANFGKVLQQPLSTSPSAVLWE